MPLIQTSNIGANIIKNQAGLDSRRDIDRTYGKMKEPDERGAPALRLEFLNRLDDVIVFAAADLDLVNIRHRAARHPRTAPWPAACSSSHARGPGSDQERHQPDTWARPWVPRGRRFPETRYRGAAQGRVRGLQEGVVADAPSPDAERPVFTGINESAATPAVLTTSPPSAGRPHVVAGRRGRRPAPAHARPPQRGPRVPSAPKARTPPPAALAASVLGRRLRASRPRSPSRVASDLVEWLADAPPDAAALAASPEASRRC